MEIKIKGRVIERSGNGETCSFKIKSTSSDVIYIVKNCSAAQTSREDIDEEAECYNGNIELDEEGVVKIKSVILWIFPNNECVLVYNV